MNGPGLQPLSLGELLDRAFTVYRRHFWLFVGIMAIPSCLYIPVEFLFLRTKNAPFPWSKAPLQTHVAMIAYGALFWIISSVAYGAATCAVADVYLDRRTTIQGAYARIRGRFWRLMSLNFNVGLRVLGLILLLVLGGAIAGGLLAAILSRGSATPGTLGVLLIVFPIILGVGLSIGFSMRYAVSMPALLLDDIKGRAAIRRSVQLSRGRRGQLFISVLLSVVLSYTAAVVFRGPFYLAIALMGIKGRLPTSLALVLSISGTISYAITSPLLVIILVFFYYDLRIRKEGFDLQFMLTSLPDSKPSDSASLAGV